MNARRLIRVVRWPVTAVLITALLGVVPPWATAIYDRHVPRAVTLDLLIGFLEGIRLAFLIAVVIAPAGLAVAIRAIVRGRRRYRRTHPGAMRALAGFGASLLGLALLEAGSAVWLGWSHRLPTLPTRFVDGGSGDDRLDLLVVGESSALGVPYNPTLSMGQILAWQLGRVFPDREVDVEMRAAVGLTLEGAIQKLADLERRPDAVLIYSGHNEYHGRYGWDREVLHYHDELPARRWRTFVAAFNRVSNLSALVQEQADRFRAELSPPARITRQLVGRPVVTPAEDAAIIADFGRRLDALVSYCERLGAVPILVIPAGNEADHLPEVSYLAPETSAAERVAFDREFRSARDLETTDPPAAIRAFAALLDQQPGFAEAHQRLARLLEQSGAIAEARRHDRLARDLDGLPMRCPSRIQEVYRAVAARHPGAVLVDGPRVLERLAPNGLIGDELFHDAQHPNLRGYVALAQDALDRLQSHHAFGWPKGRPAPIIDPAECAAHFGLHSDLWATVCNHSAAMYRATAYIRHDPGPNLTKAALHEEAARRIRAGESPEAVGVPGLGVWPEDLPGPGTATLALP